MVRAYLGTVLRPCFVAIVVCMTIGFGCDKMSLNSLYYDVDAPILRPNYDHFLTGRKMCDRREFSRSFLCVFIASLLCI